MDAIWSQLLWQVRRIYYWYYHISRVETWSISHLVETSIGEKAEGTLWVEKSTHSSSCIPKMGLKLPVDFCSYLKHKSCFYMSFIHP